ncbi:blue light receptor [Tulasnella sp. 403]|nr:blue light receptor [Tulasnella sp. 403]
MEINFQTEKEIEVQGPTARTTPATKPRFTIMDPATASLHQPQHSSAQDPAQYLYERAQYALQSSEPWSPSAQPPIQYSTADTSPRTASKSSTKSTRSPTASVGRVTRNRAAALAKEADGQQLQQQPSARQQQHGQQQQLAQPYPPPPQNFPSSGYLNQDPAVNLNGDASGPFSSTGSNVYSYPPPHFPNDRPTSSSPPANAPATGPNHPPSAATHSINGNLQHSPLANVYPPGATADYHPQMLVPGRVEGYSIDDMTSTVYAPPVLPMGTEIMRVPSASPSVASGELGSPAPEDFPPALDQGHASTRSSSNPRSLENYDYGGSGPISPLSANYAPQALPSTFSSMAGGYLHGPPTARGLSSSHSFPAPEADLVLPSANSVGGGTASRARTGQKTKTKLTDMDRKFICVFAQNHPKARQEDIATKFAVERSTVSKILKCKDKWMKVDFFSSEARVVKHRPSKFPELEETLIHNIRLRMAAREPVNDAFIKKMALELAQERGIGKDKFKASSGWVENFKHRHDLRKGGSWEKTGAVSWAATANEKYGNAGELNGTGSMGPGSNDEQGGSMDPEGDYHDAQYGIGTAGPADYVNDGGEGVGEEESGRLVEEPNLIGSAHGIGSPVALESQGHNFHSQLQSSFQQHEANPSTAYLNTESFVSENGADEQGVPGTADASYQNQSLSGNDDRISKRQSMVGSDHGSTHGGSPSQFNARLVPRPLEIRQQLSGGTAPNDASAQPLSANSPNLAFQTLQAHSHMSTPRSGSVLSRSGSSASLGSIAPSPVIGGHQILTSGGLISPTSTSMSPQSGQFATAISGSPMASHFHVHGPAHHRRSMSASYTSSPLAVEVSGLSHDTTRLQDAMGTTPSPGGHAQGMHVGSSLALHNVPSLPTSPSLRLAASRRSVTFSSVSVLTAGLTIDDFGNHSDPNAHTSLDERASQVMAAHHGHIHAHARSLSHGAATNRMGGPSMPFSHSPDYHLPNHHRSQSMSTSSTAVHRGSGSISSASTEKPSYLAGPDVGYAPSKVTVWMDAVLGVGNWSADLLLPHPATMSQQRFSMNPYDSDPHPGGGPHEYRKQQSFSDHRYVSNVPPPNSADITTPAPYLNETVHFQLPSFLLSALTPASAGPHDSIPPFSHSTDFSHGFLGTNQHFDAGDKYKSPEEEPAATFHHTVHPSEPFTYDAPLIATPQHTIPPLPQPPQPISDFPTPAVSWPIQTVAAITGPNTPLYSSTGFDMLWILSRVAARPNPTIVLGPVDLSCSFVVVDVRQYDHPIVYASPTFFKLTGYNSTEVIGRNCRFLQAPDGKVERGSARTFTDPAAVGHIKKCLAAGKECQANLMNYRKGGVPFLNLVSIIPITGENSSEIQYHVGFQVDLVHQPNAILQTMRDGTYLVNYSTTHSPTAGLHSGRIRDRDAVDRLPDPLRDLLGKMVMGGPTQVLQNSDEQNRHDWNAQLLEHADDFVHVFSVKGILQYASPALLRALEYSADELVGRPIAEIAHPQDLTPVMRELKEASTFIESPTTSVRQQKTVQLLFRVRRKHSGMIWLESSGRLHMEPGKTRKSVIFAGRMRDLHPFTWGTIQQAGGLGTTGALTKTGLTVSEFWAKVSTGSGLFVFVDRGVKDVLGRDSNDVVGTSILDVVQSTDRTRVMETVNNIADVDNTTANPFIISATLLSERKTLSSDIILYPSQNRKFTGPSKLKSARPSYIIMQFRLRSIPSTSPSRGRSMVHASGSRIYEELDVSRATNWNYEIETIRQQNDKMTAEIASLTRSSPTSRR